MEAERLAGLARAYLRDNSARPSDVVMDRLEQSAVRGYTWCIIELDLLERENLNWLMLEGFGVQKLNEGRNAHGEGARPGGWRITWIKQPAFLDAH